MKEHFKPVDGDFPDMPRVIRYRTPRDERVVVKFGTVFGYPATDYAVRNRRGQVVSEGLSWGVNFDTALTAGLKYDGRRGKVLLSRLVR